MFWNSRYQNQNTMSMSAAYAEASSARASANTALTVDAILLASILVILGAGRILSLTGIIVTVIVSVTVILAVLGIIQPNRRGRRWSA